MGSMFHLKYILVMSKNSKTFILDLRAITTETHTGVRKILNSFTVIQNTDRDLL
jgi:hypothetical protein